MQRPASAFPASGKANQHKNLDDTSGGRRQRPASSLGIGSRGIKQNDSAKIARPNSAQGIAKARPASALDSFPEFTSSKDPQGKASFHGSASFNSSLGRKSRLEDNPKPPVDSLRSTQGRRPLSAMSSSRPQSR